jgi:hypothetical protein
MASAPVTPVDPRSAAYANAASATRPSSCESSSLARSAICTPRKNASRRVRPPSRRSRCGPHNAPRIDFGVMFRLRGVFKGSIVWKHLVHGKGNNTQHNNKTFETKGNKFRTQLCRTGSRNRRRACAAPCPRGPACARGAHQAGASAAAP